MSKILFVSIGTLGDINPLISFAKFLKKNNHDITIAATEYYRNPITSANINFVAVAPHYNPSAPDFVKKILNPFLTLYYTHKLILNEAQIEQGISDISAIIKDYDLVIGNLFAFHAKIACLKLNVPWVSINLSPVCFFSSYDPPYLYPLFLFKLRHHLIYKPLFKYMFKLVDYWGKEVFNSYKKHKLCPPQSLMLSAPFSEKLNIALFPKAFCPQAKDWPENTIMTNFFNYSGEDETIPEELKLFCANGESPILITFGSVTIHLFDKIKKLLIPFIKNSNHRFVITTNNLEDAELLKLNTNGNKIFLCRHLPYTTGMKLMSGVIHQGGIGTAACCLDAGIPQLIVPSCTDQFDNGFRIQNLKLGAVFAPAFKTSGKFKILADELFSDRSNFKINYSIYKSSIELNFHEDLNNRLALISSQ